MAAGENKHRLSDVLSVLATAIADVPSGTSLKYKLTGNQSEGIGLWGHEYVRNLAGEIGTEFTRRTEEADPPEGAFVNLKYLSPYIMFCLVTQASSVFDCISAMTNLC